MKHFTIEQRSHGARTELALEYIYCCCMLPSEWASITWNITCFSLKHSRRTFNCKICQWGHNLTKNFVSKSIKSLTIPFLRSTTTQNRPSYPNSDSPNTSPRTSPLRIPASLRTLTPEPRVGTSHNFIPNPHRRSNDQIQVRTNKRIPETHQNEAVVAAGLRGRVNILMRDLTVSPAQMRQENHRHNGPNKSSGIPSRPCHRYTVFWSSGLSSKLRPPPSPARESLPPRARHFAAKPSRLELVASPFPSPLLPCACFRNINLGCEPIFFALVPTA